MTGWQPRKARGLGSWLSVFFYKRSWEMSKRRPRVKTLGNAGIFLLQPVQVVAEEEMKRKQKVKPPDIAKETGVPTKKIMDFLHF